MKVCVIENIYPPYDRGGAEQVVAKTIRGLLADGHEVVLITSSPNGNEFTEEKNFKIYRKKPPNIYFYTDAHQYHPVIRLCWHFIGIFNVPIALWTRKILLHEKPDVVHTHNLMGLSFLIPGVIRRLGLRHVHTVHDVQLVEPSAMIMKLQEKSFRYTGPHTLLYAAIMKQLLGSPDVVISPSKFLLGFYRRRGFFKKSISLVVRNPITFDLPAPNRERIAQEDGQCHFLYLGQIEHHKGVLLLVDAFLNISSSYPQARLHIAGNGSQLAELREIIGNSEVVHAYGRVNREKIPELFSQSDVAVVPSLCYENSPTVIFESFYFGVPVLASFIEGVEELIQEGENGVTFEAGDIQDLELKLIWCIEHKNQLQQMSSKTSQFLSGLSMEGYMQKLMDAYKKSSH